MVSTVSILLAVLALGSPALALDKSNIEMRVEAWQKAFNAGDAAGVAAHYTLDAVRMPYQAPILKGRQAIKAHIEATYERGITGVELHVLGSDSQGKLAWACGTYVLKTADGETVQEGKWMNVSKKVKGEWLTYSDIWNTNAPE
jgi:uncharacterized protein (TIGR02246 family)